jgi:hypothetical protein
MMMMMMMMDERVGQDPSPGLESAVMSARIDAKRACGYGFPMGSRHACVCVCGVVEPGKPCSIQPSGNSPGPCSVCFVSSLPVPISGGPFLVGGGGGCGNLSLILTCE